MGNSSWWELIRESKQNDDYDSYNVDLDFEVVYPKSFELFLNNSDSQQTRINWNTFFSHPALEEILNLKEVNWNTTRQFDKFLANTQFIRKLYALEEDRERVLNKKSFVITDGVYSRCLRNLCEAIHLHLAIGITNLDPEKVKLGLGASELILKEVKNLELQKAILYMATLIQIFSIWYKKKKFGTEEPFNDVEYDGTDVETDCNGLLVLLFPNSTKVKDTSLLKRAELNRLFDKHNDMTIAYKIIDPGEGSQSILEQFLAFFGGVLKFNSEEFKVIKGVLTALNKKVRVYEWEIDKLIATSLNHDIEEIPCFHYANGPIEKEESSCRDLLLGFLVQLYRYQGCKVLEVRQVIAESILIDNQKLLLDFYSPEMRCYYILLYKICKENPLGVYDYLYNNLMVHVEWKSPLLQRLMKHIPIENKLNDTQKKFIRNLFGKNAIKLSHNISRTDIEKYLEVYTGIVKLKFCIDSFEFYFYNSEFNSNQFEALFIQNVIDNSSIKQGKDCKKQIENWKIPITYIHNQFIKNSTEMTFPIYLYQLLVSIGILIKVAAQIKIPFKLINQSFSKDIPTKKESDLKWQSIFRRIYTNNDVQPEKILENLDMEPQNIDKWLSHLLIKAGILDRNKIYEECLAYCIQLNKVLDYRVKILMHIYFDTFGHFTYRTLTHPEYAGAIDKNCLEKANDLLNKRIKKMKEEFLPWLEV